MRAARLRAGFETVDGSDPGAGQKNRLTLHAVMTFLASKNRQEKHGSDLNPWVRAVFALMVVYAGCSGLTAIRLGHYVDDANLSAAVSERFAAQKTSDFARVKTEVKDGVIYLSGTVASDEQRSRAEKVAFQVPGTKGVVNNLQVEKP